MMFVNKLSKLLPLAEKILFLKNILANALSSVFIFFFKKLLFFPKIASHNRENSSLKKAIFCYQLKESQISVHDFISNIINSLFGDNIRRFLYLARARQALSPNDNSGSTKDAAIIACAALNSSI